MAELQRVLIRVYLNIGRLSRKACIAPIRLYQKSGRFRPPVCRFTPSCSEYAVQAIQRYGVLRGVAIGAWRIMRCNPFSRGGYDPVR